MPSTTDSTITSATDPARPPAPPPVSTQERLAASAQIVVRLATTSGHGRGPLQPKTQPPELCLPIIERTAAAIVDLGSVEAVSELGR